MAKKIATECTETNANSQEEQTTITVEELQAMMAGQPTQNLTYGVAEALFLDDLDDRKLIIDGIIDEDIFRRINYFIIRWNSEDKEIPIGERRPIKLIINSCGGSTFAGLSTIETIRNSKTPVYGYLLGYAFSMAFHIYVNCHKRFATPSSIMLNHEGEYGNIDSPSKVKDAFTFYEKVNDRLNGYIAQNSKFTKKQLEDEDRIEKYMFGDEAKELGIVTELIGVDCQLDEIL